MKSFRLSSSDVSRVYDGDTFFIKVDTRPNFAEEIGVRIIGVDTPEMCGVTAKERRWAIEARDYLERRINKSRKMDFLSKSKKFRFSHGRILAVVKIDGRDIAQDIIDEGLGRKNHGEKRDGWTSRPKRKVKVLKGWSRKWVFVATSAVLAVAVMIWANY